MSPAYYYIMNDKKILRLEEPITKHPNYHSLLENMLDPDAFETLHQEQANYRVAIFRDEILELVEYEEFLQAN